MASSYDFYFKVMKSYPNGSRDCVHTEYNGGTLSDARKYAMKLFKRFDLNANGYVSISKNGKKMDYLGDVTKHRTRAGTLPFVWMPDKKWAIYKLNADGTTGQNYLKK